MGDCSPSITRPELDRRVLQARKPFHDCQTQPGAALLRRVKRFEDPVEIALGDADAAVGNFDVAVLRLCSRPCLPGRIGFRDRCGKSCEQYEGAWTFTEQNGVTGITCELTAKPAFDVPEFILKRLLKRDAGVMIDRLLAEIVRRAAGSVAVTR